MTDEELHREGFVQIAFNPEDGVTTYKNSRGRLLTQRPSIASPPQLSSRLKSASISDLSRPRLSPRAQTSAVRPTIKTDTGLKPMEFLDLAPSPVAVVRQVSFHLTPATQRTNAGRRLIQPVLSMNSVSSGSSVSTTELAPTSLHKDQVSWMRISAMPPPRPSSPPPPLLPVEEPPPLPVTPQKHRPSKLDVTARSSTRRRPSTLAFPAPPGSPSAFILHAPVKWVKRESASPLASPALLSPFNQEDAYGGYDRGSMSTATSAYPSLLNFPIPPGSPLKSGGSPRGGRMAIPPRSPRVLDPQNQPPMMKSVSESFQPSPTTGFTPPEPSANSPQSPPSAISSLSALSPGSAIAQLDLFPMIPSRDITNYPASVSRENVASYATFGSMQKGRNRAGSVSRDVPVPTGRSRAGSTAREGLPASGSPSRDRSGSIAGREKPPSAYNERRTTSSASPAPSLRRVPSGNSDTASFLLVDPFMTSSSPRKGLDVSVARRVEIASSPPIVARPLKQSPSRPSLAKVPSYASLPSLQPTPPSLSHTPPTPIVLPEGSSASTVGIVRRPSDAFIKQHGRTTSSLSISSTTSFNNHTGVSRSSADSIRSARGEPRTNGTLADRVRHQRSASAMSQVSMNSLASTSKAPPPVPPYTQHSQSTLSLDEAPRTGRMRSASAPLGPPLRQQKRPPPLKLKSHWEEEEPEKTGIFNTFKRIVTRSKSVARGQPPPTPRFDSESVIERKKSVLKKPRDGNSVPGCGRSGSVVTLSSQQPPPVPSLPHRLDMFDNELFGSVPVRFDAYMATVDADQMDAHAAGVPRVNASSSSRLPSTRF